MVGLPAIGFVEEPSLLPLLIYFNRLALKLAPMTRWARSLDTAVGRAGAETAAWSC